MNKKEKIIWSLIGFVAGSVISTAYWNYFLNDLLDEIFGK